MGSIAFGVAAITFCALLFGAPWGLAIVIGLALTATIAISTAGSA